jgi:hypothetical protein
LGITVAPPTKPFLFEPAWSMTAGHALRVVVMPVRLSAAA